MPWVQSAVLTLLAFATLISILVFVHEMGHLLVGKIFNVKVLRFSIGFGPKLFGFTKGETEYRVSALPLGGYVKFGGDVPGEELEGADKGRGYLEQPPFRKACIAFAGPAANFLLAICVGIGLNAVPHKDWAPVVGFVIPSSPAEAAGVRHGDRIISMDGEPVRGFNHFRELVSARPGRAVELTVQRAGREEKLRITPESREEANPIQTVKQGRIGIVQSPRKAEVTLLGPDTPAARAGVQTFDVVTRLDGQSIQSWEQLESMLRARAGKPLSLEVLRKREVAAPGGTLWAQDPLKLQVPAPQAGAAPAQGVVNPDGATPYGLESSGLTIFALKSDSAAAEAGLLRGDRVVSIAGKPALFWPDDVENALRAAGGKPLAMTVRRDGKLVEATVRQHLRADHDEAGVRVQVPELGAAPDQLLEAGHDEPVSVRFPFPEAVQRGVVGTWEATRGMAVGLAKIVTGDISSEAIGGPLMIADVSRKALDDGPLAFFSVMSLISISLGLMNLIPIPVLDGFHILSAAIEGIRRRPLSLRFREVANMVGVALVLSLMLFALKNDVMRKFMH